MSSKKDKKAAKKAKLEEDQPEVDQPDTPGPILDRKLEFPANNSNDDNTSEDNSSIGPCCPEKYQFGESPGFERFE